jgi:hypothetical protein
LESLIVGLDITIEMALECPIENRPLRMARAINNRRIGYRNARIRRAVMGALISKIMVTVGSIEQ